MTRFLCTNCGFWQSAPTAPVSCPVCTDFRHTPPEVGFLFLTEAEAARTAHCSWKEGGDEGVWAFSCDPRFGIGPRGYLLAHPAGNVFFDGTSWYGPEALDWLASRGGMRWLSASHPHAYGALWQLQERFDPTVAVQVRDLPWTNDFWVTWPFDDRLELAPGLELIHTGGHFDGHSVLYWAEKRLLFAGDMLKFHFDGERLTGISTHKAFNRHIPMSHAEVARYRAVVEPLDFEAVYTTFDRAACTRDMALRMFDAQLAGPPFFGPHPVPQEVAR